MQHKVKCIKILRIAAAARPLQTEFLACELLQQFRELYGADILTLTMVRAALRDQNFSPVRQLINEERALHGRLKKALIAGHQDRKGRQRHLVRYNIFYKMKHLRVRHHKRGRLFHKRKRLFQLRFLRHQRHRADIQQFPQDQLLRQNQPSFRRARIDRHHKHHGLTRFYNIRENCPLRPVLEAGPESLL